MYPGLSGEGQLLVLIAQLPTCSSGILPPRDPDAHRETLGLQSSPEGKDCIPAGPSEVSIIHSVPRDQVDMGASQVPSAQLVCKLVRLQQEPHNLILLASGFMHSALLCYSITEEPADAHEDSVSCVPWSMYIAYADWLQLPCLLSPFMPTSGHTQKNAAHCKFQHCRFSR